MNIIRCDSTHQDAWNAFVASAPDASFYHRFEWREINRACFGHRSAYLAAVDGERVLGVFPIVQLKSLLFGNIACSMPFVNYGGPVGVDAEVDQALLEAGARIADEWRVDYAEIRSRRDLGNQLPSSTRKVSMTLELDHDPEVTLGGFSRTHRHDIRRGYREGFVARSGSLELLDDFYSVLLETWRDVGTPIYAKSYFETILRAFPDHTALMVIYKGDEPAGAAMDGFHGGIAEGMWLGVRAKYKRDMAGYVLYWELIKRGCDLGLTRFHLGRSTAGSGAETFKRKWNATAAQLYWHYVLRTRKQIPELNVDNAKYRLAISAWTRLPLGVTQRLGPMIARSIP